MNIKFTAPELERTRLNASEQAEQEFTPPPPREVVVEYYNGVAETYFDRYFDPYYTGYSFQIRKQRVLEFLEGVQGRVLDVACGPGVMIPDLVRLGFEYWGLDLAPCMVEEAKHRFGHLPRVSLYNAPAEQLPFGDCFFDAVICVGAIEYTEYKRALSEMLRVLRPGGRLIVAFSNNRSPYHLWRRYIFYPIVQATSAFYGRWRRRTPSFKLLRTLQRHSILTFLQKNDCSIEDEVYYYFQLFPSPLEELFPWLDTLVMRHAERLYKTRWDWLGQGFLIKGKKGLLDFSNIQNKREAK